MSLKGEEPEFVPRFDYAVFADTQEEPRAVYEHLDWLRSLGGIPILTGTAGKLGDDLARGVNTTGQRFASIPAYTAAEEGGKEGRTRRQCTREYKTDVVEQVIRRQILGLDKGERVPTKAVHVAQYLGLSFDEPRRRAKVMARFHAHPWASCHFPLFDLFVTRAECRAWLARQAIPHTVPRSACTFCLAGDTEVITPHGERPIRELVGDVTLLVPAANGDTYRNHGIWQKAEVRSFGVQPLSDVILSRGRSVKVVRATAEHRWILAGCDGFVPTSELKKGDRLESCHRPSVKCSGAPVKPSPFGIAHGFVFGDGSVEAGNRPANVVLHTEKKRSALLPYFSACDVKRTKANGKDALRVGGLPRAWKEPPRLDESRSYLLGWLAGYFAADGTVNKCGKQAVIYSSLRVNIALTRAICYHLGIRVSPVLKKSRVGFGKQSDLYCASLSVKDLPLSFWILGHHRERVVNSTPTGNDLYPGWMVRAVEDRGEREEVFCAIVSGAERFTLADNLLTGNCPFRSNAEWRDLRDDDPEGWARAVEVDEALRREGAILNRGLDQRLYVHRSCVPLARADIDTPEPDFVRQRFSFSGLGIVEEECEGMCGL
jgi:hypothetical protein